MLNPLKSLVKREKQQIGPPVGEVDPLSNQSMTMLQHSTPPTPGTRDLLQIYSKNPKMRAAMNKIATNVAGVSWKLFVPRNNQGRSIRNSVITHMEYEKRDGRLQQMIANNEVQEITDHPVLDILTQGNDELVGFTNMQVTQTHIDLVGEAFWLKERNAMGQPVELWPLPPHWIRSLPTRNHPFYEISAIGYSGANAVSIPVTEIIYFRDPDPANPYGRGSGVGRSLADETEIDEFASKHIKNFFFNRARPDIIVSGENLSRENTKRLEEMWLQKQSGFWNAFKPLFLSRSVDIKVLSQNFEQMQMVELRKHQREVFFNALGLPPELSGQISNSNRSTISMAERFFSKFVIKPRMEFLRTHLQKRLIPDFDDRLILHFESPIEEDQQFQLEVMQSSEFAYSIDEWRKMAGIPEKEDDSGKLHLIPTSTGQLMDISDMEEPEEPEIEEEDDTRNILLEAQIEESVKKRLPELIQRTRADKH